jgi:hypothetical protein
MQIQVESKTYYVDFFHDPNEPHSWGYGVSVCNIWTEEQIEQIKEQRKQGLYPTVEPLFEGTAYCSACEKQFNRRTGRKRSFAEALANLPHAEREKWWKGYFQAFPRDMQK